MVIAIQSIALLIGAAFAFLSKDRNLAARGVRLLVPWVAVVAIGQLAGHVLDAPWDHWNATRLAPAVAVGFGIDPYCAPDAGSIQSTMYPPGTYLAFLPTALAETPTKAILGASVLNLLYLSVAPFLLFLGSASPGRSRRLLALLGIATLLLAANYLQPLSKHVTKIHADAPALFFAVSGCAVVLRRSTRSPLFPWLIAGCLCLAVWCKQTLFATAIAIPVYVAWRDGWRPMAKLLGCMAVLGAGLGIVTVIWFSPSNLFFQTVTLPSRFPFKPVGWSGEIDKFLELGWPTFVALGGAWLWHRLFASRVSTNPLSQESEKSAPVVGSPDSTNPDPEQSSRPAAHQAQPDSSHATGLLLLVALFLTPMSLVAHAKYGGQANSYHNLFFLQCAAICALVSAASRPSILGAIPLLALACTLGVHTATRMSDDSLQQKWNDLASNPQQVAYEYSRENPASVWFPWNPLSNLLAEGRLDHQERAIADWMVAGEDLQAERLLATIPPTVSVIAYPPDLSKGKRHAVLVAGARPGTSRAALSLPGWKLYLLPARKNP